MIEQPITGIKKNEFINFNKDGTFRLSTPKTEIDDGELLSELFPKKRYISLLEILSTINKACNFLAMFKHWHFMESMIFQRKNFRIPLD